MTGFAQSAALSIRKRLKPLISGVNERFQNWSSRLGALLAALVVFLRDTAAPAAATLLGRLRDFTAPAVERVRAAAIPAIERVKPLISWTRRRLQPWTALLQDVAFVVASKVADLARPLVSKVVDLVKPLVSKVVHRFGLRMTVMGTATAIFIGSTGGTAWAITSMEEPTTGQSSSSTVLAAEVELSKESAAAAANQISAEQRAAAEAQAEAEAKAAAEAAKKEAATPKPVGGLSKLQMANAVAIIEAGKDEGLGRDAWAVALATAMQESKFRNYANVNVPESYDYDYQAEGSDHDSVGLFQQRLSWGEVEDLMNPKKSASKFYKALKRVDGWEHMSVTKAAQTVQVSAFPDAYAQWEDLAWDIIESYEKAKS
ncbi:hypothetical protein [Glycomyces sp. YM15]|uniref:hypothetical protein n=1 Tax=Glycomyces sp. YM15 TaxID=2800446 RepID=UPI0019634A4E|nr:hypothetical protein [Glycomyces sp. YM15]